MKKNEYKKTLFLFLSYIIISILFYYAITIMLTGDYDTVSMIQESMNGATSDSKHDIKSLVSAYLTVMLQYGILFIVLITSWIIFRKKHFQIKKDIHWSVRLFIYVTLSVAMLAIGKDQLPAFLIILLILTIAFRECIDQNGIKTWSGLCKYIVLLLLGLIGAAGSDTSLLKAAPYYICFTPVVLIYFDKEIKEMKLYKGILFIFVLFSLYSSLFRIIVFEDGSRSSIYKYNCYYENPNVKSFVSGKWYQQFKEIEKTTNTYMVKSHTYIYGSSFLAYTLIGDKQSIFLDFWQQSNNQKQLEKILSVTIHDKEAVLIDFSKSNILKNMAETSGLVYSSCNNANIYRHKEIH